MDRKKRLSKGWIVITGFLVFALLRTSLVFADFCLADINDDGQVDGSDLRVMSAEMGRDNCYTDPCRADINGDGMVDAEDRAMLKAEFGRKDCLPHDGAMSLGQIERPYIDEEMEDEEKGNGSAYDVSEEDLEEKVSPSTTRFKDNKDGTVTGLETTLMWTKNANLPGDTMLFHQALDYIEGMNEGSNPNFGYTDWRLPTLKELRSLIDCTNYTRRGHAIPSGHPFQNVQLLGFTAVTYLSNSDYPFLLSLYCRLVGHNVKSCYGYVWPVRGGN